MNNVNFMQLIPEFRIETPGAVLRVTEEEIKTLIPVLLRNSHFPISIDPWHYGSDGMAYSPDMDIPEDDLDEIDLERPSQEAFFQKIKSDPTCKCGNCTCQK